MSNIDPRVLVFKSSRIDPRQVTVNDIPRRYQLALASMHLWERVCWAHDSLERVESRYVIPFDHPASGPDQPDCARIMCPAPEWMAMALFGGLLPPVKVYHELRMSDGSTIYERPKDPQARVVNGSLLHLVAPIGPMTEEEAIEYLVVKDVPREVWDRPGANRTSFVICTRDQIPQDRTFRNAWRLDLAA